MCTESSIFSHIPVPADTSSDRTSRSRTEPITFDSARGETITLDMLDDTGWETVET